jgi:hypothetical protein
MASERHHTLPVRAHRASAARRRKPRKAKGRTAGTAPWRAVAGCAALGLASLAGGCASNTAAGPAIADPPSSPAEPVATASPTGAQQVRPLAGPQLGQGSYYGPGFTGRRMANGRRFDPRSASAAHRTLPFGTRSWSPISATAAPRRPPWRTAAPSCGAASST